MPEWLLPAVGFSVFNGAVAISIKIAMRGIGWPQVVHWTTLAYVLTSIAVIVFGGWGLYTGTGTEWGIAFGFLAAGGLVTLFLALEKGDASLIVPITAAYPVLTALLAAIFLTEVITPVRGVGIGLVVLGAMVVGRE